MVDEIYDRNYQDGREQFHAGIDAALARLRRSVTVAFRALHDIQFEAPWTKGSKA
jgi:hypothetical protein